MLTKEISHKSYWFLAVQAHPISNDFKESPDFTMFANIFVWADHILLV